MKKELKKYGFTLVELLAVIVILAVIALITTPIILNVMDKAKKGALEDSAYGLLESANLYYAEGTLENDIAKTEFTFKDGVQTSENKLSYKGKIENGSVRLYSDGKSALCITGGNYAVVKNVNDKKVSVVKGRCSYNTETEEYETIGLCKDLQEELDGIKGLGDATSKDILIDKTAYVKGQLITGSMKNNEAIKTTISLGESYTIPEGYHNGKGTVQATQENSDLSAYYLKLPDMTSNKQNGFEISIEGTVHSSTQTNYYKAFDGIYGDYIWNENSAVTFKGACSIILKLPKQVKLLQTVFHSGFYTAASVYSPNSITVSGSNDGLNWTILMSGSYGTTWAVQSLKTNNTNQYQYFKFSFGPSGEWNSIAEITPYIAI